MKDTVLHVRVNKDIKQEAETILNGLGITMSVAINMYLKKICIEHGVPFNLKYEDYNEETKKAIKESYMIAEDSKQYSTVDEMFEDAEKWED